MHKKFLAICAALLLAVTMTMQSSTPAEAHRGGAIVGGLIAGALIGGALYGGHRYYRSYGYGPYYGYGYYPSYAYASPYYYGGYGYRRHWRHHHRHW